MSTDHALVKFWILILNFNLVHIKSASTNKNAADETLSAPAFITAQRRNHFHDQWLTVPLNHFDLFDNRTWQMRYLENRQFYKDGGPIFIEIGGEWTIGPWSASKPQIQKLASKHSGIYFATEHRYYGKSLPFSTDFSSENLKYLQVEQALEDLVFFIDYIKSTHADLKDSKVIVHGCSYGGMLATWVRSRFPHIVDISYASSAPITLEVDYAGYYEVINEVYANVTVSCIDTIKKGLNTTLELLQSVRGRKMVNDALQGWNCGDLSFMNPVQVIFKMISVLNVQNDAHHYEEISCLALIMDTDDTSAFERLANMVVLKSHDKGGCSPAGSSKSGKINNNKLGWLYQVCTELGLFQTISSKNPNHPFTIDLTKDDLLNLCTQLFGEGFTEELLQIGIERMNRRYGGRNIKVSKLLSVQGSHDPWKKLGMLKAVNSDVQIIVLDGSHCVDTAERPDDPQELTEEREGIRNIISGWIEEISSN